MVITSMSTCNFSVVVEMIKNEKKLTREKERIKE